MSLDEPRPLLPQPTALSRPFWDAARRHELLIQQCENCGRHVFYPRPACPPCGNRHLKWVLASGRASLYSFTVARRATHASFAARVPYIIAIVELDEGPHMTTNIVDCPIDALFVGMTLATSFQEVSEDVTLVNFRPG